MSNDLRPRRSALYMPASNERALEKATTLPADAIIFDLEDAVAPDAKEAARANAVAAVTSGRYGHRELTIRCNGLDTPWGVDDLAAAAQTPASAVVVPKVSGVEQLDKIAASHQTAMTETAKSHETAVIKLVTEFREESQEQRANHAKDMDRIISIYQDRPADALQPANQR